MVPLRQASARRCIPFTTDVADLAPGSLCPAAVSHLPTANDRRTMLTFDSRPLYFTEIWQH
jgi:hypothetical protein